MKFKFKPGPGGEYGKTRVQEYDLGMVAEVVRLPGLNYPHELRESLGEIRDISLNIFSGNYKGDELHEKIQRLYSLFAYVLINCDTNIDFRSLEPDMAEELSKNSRKFLSGMGSAIQGIDIAAKISGYRLRGKGKEIKKPAYLLSMISAIESPNPE